MPSEFHVCPSCLGPLPTYPGFGVDWRCHGCGRLYIALRTAQGEPLALDAHRGVFGWDRSGAPVLVQPSVPPWLQAARTAHR